LKGARIEELLEQLRVLSDGGAAMSPSVARCVLGLLRESRPRLLRPPPPVALTQRQKEVLACLADGMSYERIADEMQISVNTVRTHVRRLYDALQVEGAAEAVSKAFRHRLL
ncbi:MAG: response regulator transcription factor, partial [Myxococcales bacterium]|nr:response regulator transcription factor [Myxococcales bacterium]